jgi:hypothetical protein
MVPAFLWLLGAACASPFILFDKKTSDDFGKVNEPIHGIYTIVNLGDSPATSLHIDDAGIPLEQWEFPKSAGNLRWSTLGPGENITHIFKLVPLVAGSIRQGASRLRYVADGEKKIALSSQVIWFEARSVRSIGAKSNLRGYSIVIGCAIGSVFLPFLIWRIQKPRASAHKPKTN